MSHEFSEVASEPLQPVTWSATKYAPFLDIYADFLSSHLAGLPLADDVEGETIEAGNDANAAASVFRGAKPSAMPIRSYVHRIAQHAKCSPIAGRTPTSSWRGWARQACSWIEQTCTGALPGLPRRLRCSLKLKHCRRGS